MCQAQCKPLSIQWWARETPFPAPRWNISFLFYPSVHLIGSFWQRLLYTKIHVLFFQHTARPHFSATLTLGFDLVTEFGWSRTWNRSRVWANSRLERKHTASHEHPPTCVFLLPTNWGRDHPRKTLEVTWFCPRQRFCHTGSLIDCLEENLIGVLHELETNFYGGVIYLPLNTNMSAFPFDPKVIPSLYPPKGLAVVRCPAYRREWVCNEWNRYAEKEVTRYVDLDSPESDSETQIQVQVVPLGTGTGKPQEDSRKVRQAKEDSQEMVHCQYYNVHCGTLDFIPDRETKTSPGFIPTGG